MLDVIEGRMHRLPERHIEARKFWIGLCMWVMYPLLLIELAFLAYMLGVWLGQLLTQLSA